MDGWDIMADLVVESIRFYQYNYTKKQKNHRVVSVRTRLGGSE